LVILASSGDHSPHSIISRFELKNTREKAEQVLLILVDILHSRPHYLKVISVLPTARICLLLLGDRPSPIVATQILNLIGLGIQMLSSFNEVQSQIGVDKWMLGVEDSVAICMGSGD
jgi:hypothetical protein